MTYPISAGLSACSVMATPSSDKTGPKHSGYVSYIRMYKKRTRRDIHAPLKKPDRMAKTTIPATLLIPKRAKITTAQPKPLMIVRLKTPYLCANMLGSTRPNIDEAFRMAS